MIFLNLPGIAKLRAWLLKQSREYSWHKHILVFTAHKTGPLRHYLGELHCNIQVITLVIFHHYTASVSFEYLIRQEYSHLDKPVKCYV